METWVCTKCKAVNNREKHFCDCGKTWICGNDFDECGVNDIKENYCMCGSSKSFGHDDFIKPLVYNISGMSQDFE